MRLSRRRALALAAGGAAASAFPGSARAQSFEQRFQDVALRVARANVVDGRPLPSPAYQHGMWMRDSYWTVLALRDHALQRQTWERFARQQDPNTGQVPSALYRTDEVYYTRHDESTALFVLLALDLARYGWTPPPAVVNGAGRYLVSQLDGQGRVRSGPGPWAWWLDTLILADVDTVAYNQGVFAVALRAAVELGAYVPPETLRLAESAYAALYKPDLGTMTLSQGTTLLDVSCLVGEHLAIQYFGQGLLTRSAVADTLATFRRVDFPDGAFLGFPVATTYEGSYMPEEWFYEAPDNWPGYYHNGGSWLLYDALALDAGRRHGIPGTSDLLMGRLRAELRREETLHEYIATTPDRGDLGYVPFPWRSNYAWNAYVATLL